MRNINQIRQHNRELAWRETRSRQTIHKAERRRGNATAAILGFVLTMALIVASSVIWPKGHCIDGGCIERTPLELNLQGSGCVQAIKDGRPWSGAMMAGNLYWESVISDNPRYELVKVPCTAEAM